MKIARKAAGGDDFEFPALPKFPERGLSNSASGQSPAGLFKKENGQTVGVG